MAGDGRPPPPPSPVTKAPRLVSRPLVLVHLADAAAEAHALTFVFSQRLQWRTPPHRIRVIASAAVIGGGLRRWRRAAPPRRPLRPEEARDGQCRAVTTPPRRCATARARSRLRLPAGLATSRWHTPSWRNTTRRIRRSSSRRAQRHHPPLLAAAAPPPPSSRAAISRRGLFATASAASSAVAKPRPPPSAFAVNSLLARACCGVLESRQIPGARPAPALRRRCRVRLRRCVGLRRRHICCCVGHQQKNENSRSAVCVCVTPFSSSEAHDRRLQTRAQSERARTRERALQRRTVRHRRS